MIYSEFFSDKVEQNQNYKKDKILCIVEGKDELNLVKKIYQICENIEISCQDFLNNKIELSWGKSEVFWNDIEKCNFQGGHITGCSTPYPVLESLKNKNIDVYKSILIVFDGDCDVGESVYNSAKALTEVYKKFILRCEPCLEKEMVLFLANEQTSSYIEMNYQLLEDSKCKWYKNNIVAIPKKDKFRRIQSLEKAIFYLEEADFSDSSDKINLLKSFLQNC